jgi:hypothetical protein
VGQVPDNYFVRLGVADPGPAPVGSRRAVAREGFAPVPPPGRRARRRAHRRRISGRSLLLSLLAIALVGWAVWAAQQPGGVSGTVNGFVDHVRGGVEGASSGPDVRRAAGYFNEQYAQAGSYPRLTEEQATAAGIGIDIDVVPCDGQAVVLRTLTVSRLLLAGRDLGEVSGAQACPADLRRPAPWKLK